MNEQVYYNQNKMYHTYFGQHFKKLFEEVALNNNSVYPYLKTNFVDEKAYLQ